MIIFWVAAAVLSAAAASLIVMRAAGAARAADAPGEDPALGVYRRQLAEIDDLTTRGLIPPQEQRSARAEAARRLLAAADRPANAGLSPAGHPTAVGLSSAGGRGVVMAAAALSSLAAIGLYVWVGQPGAPDLPFAKRLAAWGQADPATLEPAQMAAVLRRIAQSRPADAQPLYYEARAQLAAGDPFAAEASLRRAAALAPARADIWDLLGQALAQEADDKPSDDARQAFQRAAALDPTAPSPRYFLARDRIASGDVAGGLTAWRALEASLPADDPRRAGLAQEIAEVERTGALPRAEGAPGPADAAGGQGAFIRGMVARLAARLEANPDDPAGWGRLIRSYGVLGDETRRQAALARARQLFKDRPEAMRVLAAASGGQT